MCAHKVIGMSLIALTCASVVASTFIELDSQNESDLKDPHKAKAAADGCDTRIVHDFKPLPSTEEERRHALIVGHWVGESELGEGRKRRFLAEHFADGTFRVTFRTTEGEGRGRIDQHYGKWGISGPVFFTTVMGIAGKDAVETTRAGDPYNDTAYEVLDISDEIFEYESFSPRIRYLARRVSDDFKPDDL